MSRLALVERTKLNLQEVTVLLKGANTVEVDMLLQVFLGFGAGHIRRAETGNEMKKTISAEPVDLIVIDAGGALNESLALVSDLRRTNGDNRYAPVVLTSANVVSPLLRATCDAGVNYVIAKPITPRILFERLVWIVRDGRSFIESQSYVGPDRRVRAIGPPAGFRGRRHGDLPPEVGEASTPNLSQADIDAMMSGKA